MRRQAARLLRLLSSPPAGEPTRLERVRRCSTAAPSETVEELRAALSAHEQLSPAQAAALLAAEPALGVSPAAAAARLLRFQLVLSRPLLQLYPTAVAAALLAGGPRLVERLLGTEALLAGAPPPAMAAALLLQGDSVPSGTAVGDCTEGEAPPLKNQPSSRLVRSVQRAGRRNRPRGEAGDEEEEGEDDWALDGETEEAPVPEKAEKRRRPKLQGHVRGSPPPKRPGSATRARKRR